MNVLETCESKREGIDCLHSSTTTTLHVEFTSRCDLRCVYCSVSRPHYVGQDLDVPENFDQFIKDLKSRKIQEILINGHGETLILKNWRDYCLKLLDAGFNLKIITNFARELQEEDYEALSRLSGIQVSCDTVDLKLFKQLRRGGDFRMIVYNMGRVRAAAWQAQRTMPIFSWSCVVTDQNALGLEQYVAMGLVAGVEQFTFCNLVKYPDIVDRNINVSHITELPDDEYFSALGAFQRALQLIKRAGRNCDIQDGLLQSIEQRKTGVQNNLLSNNNETRGGECPDQHKSIVSGGAIRYSKGPAVGQTRDCLDPWNFALINAKGEILPCCWHTSIGSLGNGPTFDEVLNNSKIKKIRQNLLTGNLDEKCQTCPARPLTDIGSLQEKVTHHLTQIV